jgi:hypothetical protein
MVIPQAILIICSLKNDNAKLSFSGGSSEVKK